MSGPTIRPATPADVLAISRLETELFGIDSWSLDLVRGEVGSGLRSVVVAEVEGALVGYAVTSCVADVAELLRIGVAAWYQRHGLAAALLAESQQRSRREGAHRMLLEVSAVNRPALAFYAAAGFVEIDRRRRYYRDGSDAVVLRASLGTAACGRRGNG